MTKRRYVIDWWEGYCREVPNDRDPVLREGESAVDATFDEPEMDALVNEAGTNSGDISACLRKLISAVAPGEIVEFGSPASFKEE